MARIEKNQNLEQEIEELQDERLEVEKTQKKSGGWFKWLAGFFLLVILGLAGFLVYVLSASGLATVPVASDWFYKIPTPIHKVASGPPLETYISETFGSILTERLQTGSGSLADRTVEISLSEASITNSFRSLVIDSEINWFEASGSQIAIDSQNGLEVFLPLANQTNGNAIKLFLKLGADKGLLTLDNTKVIIGNLTVPIWLSDVLVGSVIKQGLGSVNQEIGRYASIQEVVARNGSLDLIGTLVVEIMKIQ